MLLQLEDRPATFTAFTKYKRTNIFKFRQTEDSGREHFEHENETNSQRN